MSYQDIFSGGVGAAGFADLYNDLDKQKGNVGNFFGDLQQGIDERSQFQPWSIKSGVGWGGYNQDTGGLEMALSPRQRYAQNTLWDSGMDLMQRGAQDPAARQQEFYERMRAGQMPGERRALQGLDQQMFSRGRTGMGTTEYGSSPERFAFEKARAEADNQAWLGSQQAAQQEALQQYNMGSGMFTQGYAPQQQLLQQMGMGMNQAQLMQNQQFNNASLFAQLGLGEESARTNYANLQNQAQIEGYKALAGMAGGLGSAVDEAGGVTGLWGKLNDWWENR